MIEVEQLTKNYGAVKALSGVSFSVGRGEVVGFVGPNGAGKSTTLRIITGFIGASSGRVCVADHDVSQEPMLARQSIGYMPETAPLYPEMRVVEYMTFRARIKQVGRKSVRSMVERAMTQAGVTEMRERLIGTLSKGYRQRVALADALVADPPLLILDEPTAGLDPNQIKEVRRLLKELGENHTILLSTHILSEVEATCDRALVIHQGKLVLEGPLSELRDEQQRALLELSDPEDRANGVFTRLDEIERHTTLSSNGSIKKVRLHLAVGRGSEAFEAITRALVEAGLGVRGLTREKARLEDVFSQLTDAVAGAQRSETPE